MNTKFIPLFLLMSSFVFSQITFNGCHGLLDDQNFVFNNTGTDAQNKKIYITTPVDGAQDCGGIGTCELKIQWNNTLTRWEIIADSGNGDFANTFLLYYNSTGNNLAANPPSNSFGTWVENTAVTNGECGGNLSTGNSVLTGDVHSSGLSVDHSTITKIQIFPNPVADVITISGVEQVNSVNVFNSAGQLVKSQNFGKTVIVKDLPPGVYVLKVMSSNSEMKEFKFIKK